MLFMLVSVVVSTMPGWSELKLRLAAAIARWRLAPAGLALTGRPGSTSTGQTGPDEYLPPPALLQYHALPTLPTGQTSTIVTTGGPAKSRDPVVTGTAIIGSLSLHWSTRQCDCHHADMHELTD